MNDDLHSVCSDQDGAAAGPQSAEEALYCALPLNEVLALVHTGIVAVSNTDPQLPYHQRIDLDDEEDDNVGYFSFVQSLWERVTAIGGDCQCVYIQVPAQREKRLLPYLCAVGFCLLARLLNRGIVVYLPYAAMGVPGTQITLRRLLRLCLRPTAAASGRPVCMADVLHALWDHADQGRGDNDGGGYGDRRGGDGGGGGRGGGDGGGRGGGGGGGEGTGRGKGGGRGSGFLGFGFGTREAWKSAEEKEKEKKGKEKVKEKEKEEKGKGKRPLEVTFDDMTPPTGDAASSSGAPPAGGAP